jgi:hypothetical protein
MSVLAAHPFHTDIQDGLRAILVADLHDQAAEFSRSWVDAPAPCSAAAAE